MRNTLLLSSFISTEGFAIYHLPSPIYHLLLNAPSSGGSERPSPGFMASGSGFMAWAIGFKRSGIYLAKLAEHWIGRSPASRHLRAGVM